MKKRSLTLIVVLGFVSATGEDNFSLGITRSGTDVVLSWEGPGFLQQTAPLEDKAWQTWRFSQSPLRITPEMPALFYRLSSDFPTNPAPSSLWLRLATFDTDATPPIGSWMAYNQVT